MVIIQMALMFIHHSDISFRSVSKIFVTMNICLDLHLRIPSHTTVLIWMKKQGVANFRDKQSYQDDKWILIIDESVQFGNKKLLAVLAISEQKLKSSSSYGLNYRDLQPLILKSSESWKAGDIQQELNKVIDPGQIQYVVSDGGNNLKNSYQLMGLKHIEDVGHKFSWIVKQVFEEESDFICYTKACSSFRGKYSISKYAHLIPPNQRVVSRFMNLTPLFEWGTKILGLLERGLLEDFEIEKINFVIPHKELIFQVGQLIQVLNAVQKILKTEGFSAGSKKKCLDELKVIKDARGKRVVKMIKTYFEETLSKISKKETVLCCSDIVESCFGKYKSVVKANKAMGITDLCLCISSLTTDFQAEQIRQAMEIVKVEDIKQWKNENIGESLLGKRNKLFKKWNDDLC